MLTNLWLSLHRAWNDSWSFQLTLSPLLFFIFLVNSPSCSLRSSFLLLNKLSWLQRNLFCNSLQKGWMFSLMEKNHTNQLWCLLGQDYKPLGHPPYQTERQAVSLSCLCPNGSFEQSLSNVLHTSRLRYSSDYTGEFDVLFICNGLNEKWYLKIKSIFWYFFSSS